jgi:hypothetical protein
LPMHATSTCEAFKTGTICLPFVIVLIRDGCGESG